MLYEKEKKLAASRAAVMKAMAHPTRMFILELLSRENLSVGDLTQAVGADVSTVSRHLSLLKQEGILHDIKDGNRVYYSLSCPCILEFIHCVDSVIIQDLNNGMLCLLTDSIPT